MTCQDLKTWLETTPRPPLSRAMNIACLQHVMECPACLRMLDAAIPDSGDEDTPERIADDDANLTDFLNEALADPETEEQAKSVLEHLAADEIGGIP